VYLIHLAIGFVGALLTLEAAWHFTARGGYHSLRKMIERILVVDDESDVCFVLEKVLSENGFVVDSYADPLLALSNFKAHTYSLVILDIRMPGINGFALYREIRRLDKKVKVCFLTAGQMYYGYSDIFSSLPANHFIRKPIDNEELMKRINEIMVDDTTVLILNE
jgi:DNA-binding response OmpR family regulator